MRAPSLYILIIAGLFILSFLYLYMHAVTLEFTIRFDERKKELVNIEEEIKKLRVDIAQLLSYSRIKALAEEMAYRPPKADEIVIIYESDTSKADISDSM